MEKIATEGTLKDAVKLKANIALLNKVLPDLTKNEVKVTVSPYERILAALEEGDKNDDTD